jgi:hypothetical protein
VATDFDAARGRLGRLPLAATGVLWVLSVVSGFFAGIAGGFVAVVAIGLPMAALGLGSVAGVTYFVGWFTVVAWAVLAPPAGAMTSERIATRVSRARRPDPANPADQAIVERVDTIAIAAGVHPDVRIVDAEFADAAGVGRVRVGGRLQPVVIVTRGASSLPEPAFRALAASALTDAVEGRGAALARAFALMPPLLPALALRRVFHAARRHGLRSIVIAFGILYACGIAAALTASGTSTHLAQRLLLAPFVAIGFTFLFAMILAVVGGVLGSWLFLMAVPGEWLTSRARAASDVAAIELTRDPDAWSQLMATAPARSVKPAWLDRLAVGWTLPARVQEASRRTRRLSRLAGMRPGVPAPCGST